jgi:hypothetical protein
MPAMELEIDPEPSPDERAAIVVALDQIGTLAAEAASRWGRPELDQELEDPATGV